MACGKRSITAPAPTAAAVAATATPSFKLSSYNADSVNAAQFVRLLDLSLVDCSDDKLIRQLMTFVCEGFVQTREERAIRRQQVNSKCEAVFDTSVGSEPWPLSPFYFVFH